MGNYSVVLAITGGIAAYKSIEVVSRLKKLGCDVNVILSKNALEFVTPLTLETISNNPVITNMFDRETPWEVEHITLADKAQLFVVAPATANIIGKIANGIADDMLTTTIMACKTPKLIVPAMNCNMYENQIVQNNINKLKDMGYIFIGPEKGMLACGYEGYGRMSEPEKIVSVCLDVLNLKKDLQNKKIVVTAGPTKEYIDPVRFITNHSSGKMGYEIGKAAKRRGADVVLVSGAVALKEPDGVKVVKVGTTKEMLEAVLDEYEDSMAIIKAAAPADYRPANYSRIKIKKNSESLDLELVKNPDIAKTIGEKKTTQKLIVFAAETNNLIKNAKTKCKKKNADMVVANDIGKLGAGFGVDTNIVSFVFPNGKVIEHDIMSKAEVADAILDELVKL